jgi:hypothetical protein
MPRAASRITRRHRSYTIRLLPRPPAMR